ncbi:hypothetical protein BHE74_00050527 [Ensete ventricosum]|nr:hypothetical protein GW17_00059067 [Ensete ventricosum]RWW43771.1 hypothetical protein BHE74_00050527 [Ensete ventricosum]RZR91869.1 hypothetical protein BHM03_00020046 [Ensete ventricosum]
MAYWPSTSIVDDGIKAKAARRGGQPWPNPLQGWSAMARTLEGATTHGQVGYRGSRLRPKIPTRERLDACRDNNRRGSSRPWARLAMASPQGRQPPTGIATYSTAPAGVAAPWQGDCRRARVATACAGAAMTV